MMNFPEHNFAPVMNYPAQHKMEVFDLSKGYNDEHIRAVEWGIGKYDEKREAMYTTAQFGGRRNIHMGIDIWAKAESPVFSFYHGRILYMTNNAQPGGYGPTLVTSHRLDDQTLYALYGHLSTLALSNFTVGDAVSKGQQIATIGTPEVNGGWPPHLHFQLSVVDPSKADMPGVVAEEDHEQALQTYPDPRLVLGDLY